MWELAAGAMRFALFAALGLILIVSMPLWLPLVALSHWLDQRRLHAAAERSACVACNQILGRKAVKLADQYWEKHMAELLKGTDGSVRFRRRRIVRKLHAVCSNCGAKYEFISQSRQFASLRKEDLPDRMTEL